MDINFYSAENMDLLWEYVRMLLQTTSPGVMIWFAIVSVGFLLVIIVKAFKGASGKKDDDEIEIKHY